MSEGGYRDHFGRVHIRKDKTNPRRFAYLLLLLFAAPSSWPWMAAGTVFALAGIAFHGWAAGYLARAGYSDRETVLTLLGPYRHNRNPYYLAHMVMDLGMFCLAGLAPFYLLYFPIIFLVYRRWVLNEEPFLQQEFGEEYEQMCREVPRWGIRLTPAPKRGPDERFKWWMYFFNGEHWRSGSHLIWVAIFWAFWFLGNPFAQLPALVPVTVAGVVGAYYVLHDITPREVSRSSRGWLAAAVLIAVAGAVYLAVTPLWAVWPGPWDWGGRALGIALGATLVVGALMPRAQRDDGQYPEPYRVAIVPWYLQALTLGLLSATFGGVWLAIVGALVAWALSIAGVLPLRALPRNGATASAVLAIMAVGLLCSLYLPG